ncbi:hypothetical protein M501DRAFT_992138 [Patellaria atrata CBS 101060]|uniref:Uncharacterized protein n=1 Tax=Patellaria atrata CBS 101060 TaxID=1346257 RepID=A0A9P4SC60_9PEZI|nr:hypothetical protein M501DRAFT_992138 [Patellaria atrata CBS 101060]
MTLVLQMINPSTIHTANEMIVASSSQERSITRQNRNIEDIASDIIGNGITTAGSQNAPNWAVVVISISVIAIVTILCLIFLFLNGRYKLVKKVRDLLRGRSFQGGFRQSRSSGRLSRRRRERDEEYELEQWRRSSHSPPDSTVIPAIPPESPLRRPLPLIHRDANGQFVDYDASRPPREIRSPAVPAGAAPLQPATVLAQPALRQPGQPRSPPLRPASTFLVPPRELGSVRLSASSVYTEDLPEGNRQSRPQLAQRPTAPGNPVRGLGLIRLSPDMYQAEARNPFTGTGSAISSRRNTIAEPEAPAPTPRQRVWAAASSGRTSNISNWTWPSVTTTLEEAMRRLGPITPPAPSEYSYDSTELSFDPFRERVHGIRRQKERDVKQRAEERRAAERQAAERQAAERQAAERQAAERDELERRAEEARVFEKRKKVKEALRRNKGGQ